MDHAPTKPMVQPWDFDDFKLIEENQYNKMKDQWYY